MRPLLLGLLSWVVAILCLLAAVLLADFGAGLPWLLPPVLYLLTLGLPTFAAAHVVIWLLDAAGPLPSVLWLLVATAVAQVGAALWVRRWD